MRKSGKTVILIDIARCKKVGGFFVDRRCHVERVHCHFYGLRRGVFIDDVAPTVATVRGAVLALGVWFDRAWACDKFGESLAFAVLVYQ